MNTENPYQAPSSDVSEAVPATYQPKIFTTQGRIGRLRYLAYGLASGLILIPVVMVAALIPALFSSDAGSDPTSSTIFIILVGLAYVFYLFFSFVFAKRRFNDMDQSGWLCILIIVPLLNLIAALFLIFAPGTKTANKFGPAPAPNTTWVKIGGLAMPVIAVLGILAAVAIPAYQDYVERAAQSTYSE